MINKVIVFSDGVGVLESRTKTALKTLLIKRSSIKTQMSTVATNLEKCICILLFYKI